MWYVVHCKAGQINEAMKNLSCQGYDVYCPSLLIARIVNRKSKLVRTPMFGAYLFISSNKTINTMAINSTKGVYRLIAFAGTNAHISDQQIVEIKERELYLNSVLTHSVPRAESFPVQPIRSFAAIPEFFGAYSVKERTTALMLILKRLSVYKLPRQGPFPSDVARKATSSGC